MNSEGWSLHNPSKAKHYFRNNWSLCGKVVDVVGLTRYATPYRYPTEYEIKYEGFQRYCQECQRTAPKWGGGY